MNRKELVEQIFAKKSFLCVGLDTDINKLPKCITESEDIQGAEAEMIFRFNQAIIDATAPYCVAYKPNLAFYESRGIDGMIAFENTIKYLHSHYPNHFIIADAKRGDIGNTSKMYAQTFFEEYNIDSVTVAPYMGEDSVKPFLEYDGKWVILLALTSNKGSHDFQLTEDKEGERLFEKVLKKSQEWGNDENMMYVVGATVPPLFKAIHDCSETDWKEMYQVFNMGHRMEIYVRPEVAEKVIAISKSFNIDAQIVGHIEEGKRSLTIKSEFGTFEY